MTALNLMFNIESGLGTKDMLGCERIVLVGSEIQVTGNESGIGHET